MLRSRISIRSTTKRNEPEVEFFSEAVKIRIQAVVARISQRWAKVWHAHGLPCGRIVGRTFGFRTWKTFKTFPSRSIVERMLILYLSIIRDSEKHLCNLCTLRDVSSDAPDFILLLWRSRPPRPRSHVPIPTLGTAGGTPTATVLMFAQLPIFRLVRLHYTLANT